jgi:sugar lactone lactonase YvrE
LQTPAVLMEGITFGEQPRWHDGRIWFSDWGTQEVLAVDRHGGVEVMHRASSFPLCVDWLPDGRLLVVDTSTARLLVQEHDGTFEPYADLRDGSQPPVGNELVVDGRGNAYVNGGGFDLMAGEPYSPGGVVLVRPDRTVRQVADGLAFPNGMAVTADNRTLIVGESYAKRLSAYEIAGDGSLGNRRVWADLGDGVPDGICIDAEGAVWYADVPNKRCVRVREGGDVLDTVALGRGAFACALGGTERQTLYILATEWNGAENMFKGEPTGQLLALPAPAPAAGWPASR